MPKCHVPHSCPAHLMASKEPSSVSPLAAQLTVTPEYPNVMSPFAGPTVRTPDSLKMMSSGPMTLQSESTMTNDPAVIEDEPTVVQGSRVSLFKPHWDSNQETLLKTPATTSTL